MKFSHLFIKQHFSNLKRKWISLPLLLIYPLILIGLIVLIVMALITPTEDDPVTIGLIDHDQSQETELLVELIETTPQFGELVQITPMSEEEAIRGIKKNKLSAYIFFPDDFTNDLYTGQSTELGIVGNPQQKVKSELVKELIDSLTRHINTSQASILTINYYAAELGMPSSDRSDLIFEQFKDFLFDVLGKDTLLKEEQLDNIVTSSPLNYYSLAIWLIINTIWLLLLYTFFYQEENDRLEQRMMLYGVTKLQQISARVVVTSVISSILMILSFVGLTQLLNIDPVWSDYIKVICLMLLYSFCFLFLLALIELLVPSQKLRLMIQIILTMGLLLISGAIVPTIYFPLSVQDITPYMVSTLLFDELRDVLLNDRLFVDYLPLSLITLTALFILVGIALWKEKNR